MEDVKPGNILKDGSRVVSTMQIDNSGFREPLMKLGDVYVTGSHLVKYGNGNNFVHVSEHPDAKPQTVIKSDWYSCLITDTHRIPIGNYIFWDWEDYYYH